MEHSTESFMRTVEFRSSVSNETPVWQKSSGVECSGLLDGILTLDP